MGQAGTGDDGRLGAQGRDGTGVAGVGTEDVVEHVQDAVGEQNVLLQDASGVHEIGVGGECHREGISFSGV